MFREKQGLAFKDLIESVGPQGAIDVIKDLLESKKMVPMDFSFKEIYEAVSSDIFPAITSELIAKEVLDAYEIVPTIGDKLATTRIGNFEDETFVGFGASEGPELVLEGRAYNDSNLSEKKTQIKAQKFGRIISITMEMIRFDQTNQILMRAQGIGEKLALHKEKTIVEKVIDAGNDSYRLNGAAPTSVYRSTASGIHKVNLATSAPFGEAGLEAILRLQHNMTDENGDFIAINPGSMKLLIPQELHVEAAQMMHSTLVPEGNDNAVNTFKNFAEILSSPFITAQSATSWYLGDFMKSFVWHEIFPLTTLVHFEPSEANFSKDIIAQYKAWYFGACGAVDHKTVYKATA